MKILLHYYDNGERRKKDVSKEINNMQGVTKTFPFNHYYVHCTIDFYERHISPQSDLHIFCSDLYQCVA